MQILAEKRDFINSSPNDEALAGVVAPGWQPTFVNYLYLGYSNATAFRSTADVSSQITDDHQQHDPAPDPGRCRGTCDQYH